MGVKPELLIPIVLEKLPDEIKLQISRKLGTSNWMIEDFMKVVRDEITARESCEFAKSQKRSSESVGKENQCTTEALLTGTRILVCAFCEQNHYHDKCNVVTEIERRKEIVRKNRLCFKCLHVGHPIRKCTSRTRCYRCKSSSHNTAICEKDWNKPPNKKDEAEQDSSLVINSQTSVLLQTANGMISDNSEQRSRQIKILLDPGSTKTYVSKRIVKQINLKPIGSKKMNVKTFGNAEGEVKVLEEYEFCIKNPKRGCNIYMKGFAVPVICSPLTSQRVEIAEKIYPILKELDLSDVNKDNSNIDLLIGADFYWTVMEGEIKRCNADGLTALNSKLGWVLSGPFDGKASSMTLNLMTDHVLNVQVSLSDEEEKLDKLVETFWNLDTLGIIKNELSVYDKFMEGVRFINGRYGSLTVQGREAVH